MGCGRTDSGVHAEQFFLHFDTNSEPGSNFAFRLNQLLPHDIAAVGVEQVKLDFHARFDAKRRKYIYRMHYQKDPFLHNKSLFLFKDVKLKEMQACSDILLSNRDFASFCKSGADNKTTQCELFEATWKMDGYILEFHIEADRFLRNMVRAIVGTVLEVGQGKRSIEEFRKIVESKDRKASGKSVAACGLYLHDVRY